MRKEKELTCRHISFRKSNKYIGKGAEKAFRERHDARPSGIDAKKSPIFIFDVNYSLTIFISWAATRNTVSANRLLSGF